MAERQKFHPFIKGQ
uniref:Uncharacterized protein n=1 Tax=Anguilla anguilla TaxID=7936 RepID=A0A0E9TLG9_ANGAN